MRGGTSCGVSKNLAEAAANYYTSVHYFCRFSAVAGNSPGGRRFAGPMKEGGPHPGRGGSRESVNSARKSRTLPRGKGEVAAGGGSIRVLRHGVPTRGRTECAVTTSVAATGPSWAGRLRSCRHAFSAHPYSAGCFVLPDLGVHWRNDLPRRPAYRPPRARSRGAYSVTLATSASTGRCLEARIEG